MLLKVFIRKTFRKTSLFPHLFTLDFNRTTDSQLGACLQKPLNTENPNSAFSPWVAVSITGQGVGFLWVFWTQEAGKPSRAPPRGKQPRLPEPRGPACSFVGGRLEAQCKLGGAGGNNGRPGRPPRFLFRCQEEPCRCRLGPSGLQRVSIARLSGLTAATVPRLGLGSCRVSPLGRLRRGARLAGDDAKTRGPGGPGGSRAFDGEGPPGTRRPRDLMSRPSGSGAPTSCQAWAGAGGG